MTKGRCDATGEKEKGNLSHDDRVILNALDVASPHGIPDVIQELVAILAHFQRCLWRDKRDRI